MLREEAARSREEAQSAREGATRRAKRGLAKSRRVEPQIDRRDRRHAEGPARNGFHPNWQAHRVERIALGKFAFSGRSALEAIAGRQFAADRKNARNCGRKAARHTGKEARRIISNGQRATGKSASGAGRDAAARQRCWRVTTGAHECENARRLGRGSTRRAARATAHGRPICAQR